MCSYTYKYIYIYICTYVYSVHIYINRRPTLFLGHTVFPGPTLFPGPLSFPGPTLSAAAVAIGRWQSNNINNNIKKGIMLLIISSMRQHLFLSLYLYIIPTIKYNTNHNTSNTVLNGRLKLRWVIYIYIYICLTTELIILIIIQTIQFSIVNASCWVSNFC